jgi:hypothetical protein
MRYLILIITVLLVSGCTATNAPNETQSNNTSQNHSPQIQEPLGPGWHCGSFKLNGTLASKRVGLVIEAARQAGFSFIGMVVDPNKTGQLDACRQMKESGLLCIPCTEAGNSEGSFIAIGVSESIPSNQTLDEMIDHAHNLGGIVYITHPMGTGNRTPWKRWDTSWDGLAVVAPMTQSRLDDQKALERWHILLNNGNRKYAFGETETKAFSTVYGLKNILDSSYQCLWIERNLTADSVKEALSDGGFYVTNGPRLEFTVNGMGPGEDFNVSYGEEVEILLKLSSDSAFNTIRIIRDGIVIQEIGKSFIDYNTTLNSTIVKKTWFAAEVWGGDLTPEYHDPVHAISNPVWVGVG